MMDDPARDKTMSARSASGENTKITTKPSLSHSTPSLSIPLPNLPHTPKKPTLDEAELEARAILILGSGPRKVGQSKKKRARASSTPSPPQAGAGASAGRGGREERGGRKGRKIQRREEEGDGEEGLVGSNRNPSKDPSNSLKLPPRHSSGLPPSPTPARPATGSGDPDESLESLEDERMDIDEPEDHEREMGESASGDEEESRVKKASTTSTRTPPPNPPTLQPSDDTPTPASPPHEPGPISPTAPTSATPHSGPTTATSGFVGSVAEEVSEARGGKAERDLKAGEGEGEEVLQESGEEGEMDLRVGESAAEMNLKAGESERREREGGGRGSIKEMNDSATHPAANGTPSPTASSPPSPVALASSGTPTPPAATSGNSDPGTAGTSGGSIQLSVQGRRGGEEMEMVERESEKGEGEEDKKEKKEGEDGMEDLNAEKKQETPPASPPVDPNTGGGASKDANAASSSRPETAVASPNAAKGEMRVGKGKGRVDVHPHVNDKASDTPNPAPANGSFNSLANGRLEVIVPYCIGSLLLDRALDPANTLPNTVKANLTEISDASSLAGVPAHRLVDVRLPYFKVTRRMVLDPGAPSPLPKKVVCPLKMIIEDDRAVGDGADVEPHSGTAAPSPVSADSAKSRSPEPPTSDTTPSGPKPDSPTSTSPVDTASLLADLSLALSAGSTDPPAAGTSVQETMAWLVAQQLNANTANRASGKLVSQLIAERQGLSGTVTTLRNKVEALESTGKSTAAKLKLVKSLFATVDTRLAATHSNITDVTKDLKEAIEALEEEVYRDDVPEEPASGAQPDPAQDAGGTDGADSVAGPSGTSTGGPPNDVSDEQGSEEEQEDDGSWAAMEAKVAAGGVILFTRGDEPDDDEEEQL